MLIDPWRGVPLPRRGLHGGAIAGITIATILGTGLIIAPIVYYTTRPQPPTTTFGTVTF